MNRIRIPFGVIAKLPPPCDEPPVGWRCLLQEGHDGACPVYRDDGPQRPHVARPGTEQLWLSLNEAAYVRGDIEIGQFEDGLDAIWGGHVLPQWILRPLVGPLWDTESATVRHGDELCDCGSIICALRRRLQPRGCSMVRHG